MDKLSNPISFHDVVDQLDAIKDNLQTDIVFEPEPIPTEASKNFANHLHCTKSWFMRVSWANKKRFLLTLLDGVNSLWTISMMLKAISNCRTKDAVLSATDFVPWSSYDQVPLDHNRTAKPLETLVQVMKEDREWFLKLDSESQSAVLLELLSLSGGPIQWEVMKRAQEIYETSRDHQLMMLQTCNVAPEPVLEKGAGDKTETYLVNWNATIRTMRNNLKLEELVMTFEDGNKTKIWKVNRTKPETIETVDFLQLLPASLAKQILTYLPKANLGDYARVNKYWAFLVDELKAESAARLKLQMELEKLQEAISRYEGSLERPALAEEDEFVQDTQWSASATTTLVPREKFAPYPVRKKSVPVTKQICKMADLTEKLARRGAADSSLFRWCDALMRERRIRKGYLQYMKVLGNGLLPVNLHFPCPLLKSHHGLGLPLRPPLYKEPKTKDRKKIDQSVSKALKEIITVETIQSEEKKSFKLWSKDFTHLVPVLKIASHQYTF